jgi:tetratricopeptide (TPR) repeat protein
MAHAGLAQAYVLQGYLLARERDEAADLASAAARRALELDESLAEAHTAAGMIKYYFEWDWEGAEAELRRAVERNPANAEAYEEYSNYLMSRGRHDEAVKTAQRGAEFDPLSILPVHQLGIAYMAAGDYESAAAQFRKAQELRPSWVWGHIKRGKALAHMGRCDEAQEEVVRAEEILAGQGVLSWSWIGFIHAICGEEQLAREKIEHLQKLSAERHVDPVGLAVIHAGLGNEEQVIELLEQSFADRSPYMVFNGLFPEFYNIPQLRQNPRYQDLLHRMGL